MDLDKDAGGFVAREIASRDGFVRFRYNPSLEHAVARLRETKEFLLTDQGFRLALEAASLSPAAVCGALWHLFGPPQDLYDDWKMSFAYYFDVFVDPSVRRPELTTPARLLLRVADWKGAVELRLSMQRRGEGDIVLEHGEDILPIELQDQVLAFFIGYLQGYLETGPLHDFERSIPPAAGGGRYGVRDGVPFVERSKGQDGGV